TCGRLNVAAALHGLQHGDFVGVLEVRSNRDSHGDARDADAERLDQLREIDGCGFTFRGRVRRHDDFLDRATLEALDEAPDLQLVRTDALQGRERTAENMIETVELARFFDGLNICRLFDDADDAFIARG